MVAPSAEVVRWQRLVTAALFAGYAGYYFCRADLTVVSNLLVASALVDDAGLGRTVALGTISYVCGKAVAGPLADRYGGRAPRPAALLRCPPPPASPCAAPHSRN